MTNEPYLIVSGDSHAGPLLRSQLREHCPSKYLDRFDEFVAQRGEGDVAISFSSADALNNAAASSPEEVARQSGLDPQAWDEGRSTVERILGCRGAFDPTARLADMDADGITSELILAGSQNDEDLPWTGGFDAGSPEVDAELRSVGGEIWNRWLAEFVSAAPERLLGTMQIPIWDVDGAVKQIYWGAEHGLRAINFPAPRPDYPAFNEDVYEPLWSAVEDVDLPLVTHTASGAAGSGNKGLGSLMVWMSEVHWLSRRGLAQMIFGQVFDRHPRLKVAFVEQRGDWVGPVLRQLDDVYLGGPKNGTIPIKYVIPIEGPKLKPSEYWVQNCFVVASFMAPYEAALRNEIGIQNLLWGSDYPHVEGCWPRTRLALRNGMSEVPETDARVILTDNGTRLFNLNRRVLDPVATRIGPTPEDVGRPLTPEEFPAYRGLAFRTSGTWL
jgi:predicted TIM-barrel fold metal-dependent hydrolase